MTEVSLNGNPDENASHGKPEAEKLEIENFGFENLEIEKLKDSGRSDHQSHGLQTTGSQNPDTQNSATPTPATRRPGIQLNVILNAETLEIAVEGSKEVGPPKFFRRPRHLWVQALTQFVEEQSLNIHRVSVRWGNLEPSILKQQPVPPALLVNSGYERWMELQSHSQNALVRALLEYIDAREMSFPVGKREGKASFVVEEENLEMLHKKFQLSGVKTICLCFLHALEAPTTENKAAEYFTALGYRVFQSHRESPFTDEVNRWSACLLSGLQWNLMQRDLEELRQAFTEPVALDPQSLTDPNLYRCENALLEWFDEDASEHLFYCGLENLLFLAKDSGGTPFVVDLNFQPFTALEPSFHFFPEVEQSALPQAPLYLSAALRPTLFDLLVYSSELNLPIERDKNKARLLESLLSLYRGDIRREIKDPEELMRVTRQIVGWRLSQELKSLGRHEPLRLCGPLAKEMAGLLGAWMRCETVHTPTLSQLNGFRSPEGSNP